VIAPLYSGVGLKTPPRFVRVASPPAGQRLLAGYEAAHGLPEPVFVPSTGWQGEYYETRGRRRRISAAIGFRDDWAAILTQ
jgi:hypothetical protein